MAAAQMPAPGPAGRNLAANVDRLRRERGLSWRRLSAELEKAGRPIPPLGLARMAALERRTDVDELLALAEVLSVSPGELLAPPGADSGPDHAALREVRALASCIGRLLAAADDRALAARHVSRSLRRVQIEIEELLDEAPETGKGTG